MECNEYKIFSFENLNLARLKNVANLLARNLSPGYIICLYGDLGSGKTTITRFIIREILQLDDLVISSPTFSIAQHYTSDSQMTIWHFDLYRLKSKEEVFEVGIVDAMNEVSIIEWPEIIESYLPREFMIKLYLEFSHNEADRDMKIYIPKKLENISNALNTLNFETS